MPAKKQKALGRRGFLKAGLLSSGIAVAAASQSKSQLRQGGQRGKGSLARTRGREEQATVRRAPLDLSTTKPTGSTHTSGFTTLIIAKSASSQTIRP